MVEGFIFNYPTKLDLDSFTLHGHRSFLNQEPLHSFTKALDRHIDTKRYPTTARASEQLSKKTKKNL